MLTITILGDEIYDEETEEFSTVNDVVIDLEHSLVSLSKWESKHCVPFLTAERTAEQTFDYLKFMVLTPGIADEVLYRFSDKNLDEVQKYIDSNQSATTFGDMPKPTGRGEIITSELIYYWMLTFNIPFECQYWHLNRLFSLIKICNIKTSKPKKMSKHEIAMRNRELNEKRRAQLGTAG